MAKSRQCQHQGIQWSQMTVPFLTWHPVCSRADSKKPPPWIFESIHGGANWMMTSLNVSKPAGCCASFTRKQKQPLVSAKSFMACLRVLLFLVVTGESIFVRKLFLNWTAPAANSAPRSLSKVPSEFSFAVSVWMNSPAVSLLRVFKTRHFLGEMNSKGWRNGPPNLLSVTKYFVIL